MPTEISAEEAEHKQAVKARSFTLYAERALVVPEAMKEYVRAYRERANKLCPPDAPFFRLVSLRQLDIFDEREGQNVPYRIKGTLIFYN